MLKRLGLGLALLFSVSILGVPPASSATSSFLVAAASITYFATENAAASHCLRDIVVWLNIPTGIYHYKGERWTH